MSSFKRRNKKINKQQTNSNKTFHIILCSGKRRSRDRDGERAESGYASDVRENSASSQRVSSAGRTGIYSLA